MKKTVLALCLACSPLLCHTLIAQTNQASPSVSSHSVHTHGHAVMMLAAENRSLLITLESPSVNLAGFEHQAKTAEQEKIVENIKEKLTSVEDIFQFKGVDCTASKIEIDVSAISNNATNHQSTPQHNHRRDAHNTHHSDIIASYSFICSQQTNTQPTAISVNLLAHFDTLEKLNVQWVTENAQGAIVLTKNSHILHLQ